MLKKIFLKMALHFVHSNCFNRKMILNFYISSCRGLKILAKTKIYILSRAQLLITVWDEIPCISGLSYNFEVKFVWGLEQKGLVGRDRPLYWKTILDSDCENSSGKWGFQFTFHKISGLLYSL